MMKKLTTEQAAIITGFTGNLIGKFSDFHGDVEHRLGRPIFTHEFASEALNEEIKQAYRDDFMEIQPEGTKIPTSETTMAGE